VFPAQVDLAVGRRQTSLAWRRDPEGEPVFSVEGTAALETL